jgi:hypothetical protein
VRPPERADAGRHAQILGVVLVVQLVPTAVAPVPRRLVRDGSTGRSA